MRTRCLSIHAGYRCRHQGVCCTADWSIEVEEHIADALQSARIVPIHRSDVPGGMLVALGDGPGRTVARNTGGECVFHQDSRCGLQTAGGEALLPSACRHFPRVLLLDGRGCLLTLSHFCPTAAAMLVDDVPIRIVEAAPPLALAEPLEGLDARDALPPLLRPGMLMDLDGYAAWEEAAVNAFATDPVASLALARIAAATEDVRGWTPARGPLDQAVTAAFASAAPSAPALSLGFELARSLTGPHPDMTVPVGFEGRWLTLEGTAAAARHRAIARYMAAATFGNWMAYRGRGLRSIVEWLRACFDVLRVQLVHEAAAAGGLLSQDAMIAAFRRSDYLLVHTIDSAAFGRAAAIVER